MERWLIHWPREVEAPTWPFGEGWRSVVASNLPLPGALREFGLVSMCDGATERPHVPANLPRLEPQGRYEVAIYHDRRAIYVLFTGQDAPAVITREDAECRAGMLADLPASISLYLVAADSPLTASCTRLFNGEIRHHATWSAHGPRVPAEPPVAPSMEFCESQQGETFRCGWRMTKASLADYLNGGRLRFSLLWQSCVSLELAVCGSSAGWGIRTDEMLTVRLVNRPSRPLGPSCQRAVLAYDPAKETATLEMNWRALYGEHERVGAGKERRTIHSHCVSLTVNNDSRLYGLRPEVVSEAFKLEDGHNRLQITTAGGEPVVVYVEKRSGNRIAPCPHPEQPVRPREEILAAMRLELDRHDQERRSRQNLGGELDLLAWPLYGASSCGRYYHYLEQDPRYLEIVRDVADRALALQRPDGTFSGYHLGRQHYANREAPAWAGGAYDSGQAGELWCIAAWLLEDEKYLEASRRLLAAYSGYRIEFNQNFAAFTLYHLVTHYHLTQEPAALDEALFYCRTLVATKILPLGYQSGHNYYTVYGFITLRGMAMLCQVLPTDHPYRLELRELCLRMANQLLSRLQEDGTFDSRDRVFVGERLWLGGLFSVTPLLDIDDLKRLDVALQQMLQATLPPGKWGFLDSEVIRYLAAREDLLAGRSFTWR